MIDLLNIFLFKKCEHSSISPDNPIGYCTDCGELVAINWYIARCNCCYKKIMINFKNNRIKAANKYCSNCGDKSYNIEKIDKLTYFDINYAISQKEIVNPRTIKSKLQIWVEEINSQRTRQYKLLPVLPIINSNKLTIQ